MLCLGTLPTSVSLPSGPLSARVVSCSDSGAVFWGGMSLVVMVTLPPERAHDLARTLVAEHLAGCVNIVPGLHSVYRWHGDVAEDPESLLLIKTSGERYPDLEARIKALHPYEVPEIIALQFDRALPEFQAWLRGALELTNRSG